MNCPACGAETPEDNRFCGAWGAPQVLTCSGCGTDNPAANKFCGGCGAPLQGQPKPEPAKAPEPAPEKAPPEDAAEPAGEAARRLIGGVGHAPPRSPASSTRRICAK